MRLLADHSDPATLKRQRNRLAMGAVVLLLTTLGFALPRRIHDYRELKQANEEIVRLQQAIGMKQGEIGSIQNEIRQAQEQLRAAQQGH